MPYEPVHTRDDLLAYMRRYDFTSMELAAALCVHRVTVGKWRGGKLPISTVLTLALGSRDLIVRERVRERRRARAGARE